MTRMPPPSASSIAVEPAPAAHGPAATARAPDAGRREPVRLLLLTDTSIAVAGGSERFLRNLVTLLPREHYRITVVQLINGYYPGTRVTLELDHVTLLDLPVGAVYGRRGLQALRDLRTMLKRERFDIVQSQHEKSDLFNALLPAAHGQVRISCRRDMGFKKSQKLKFLFRFLNNRFDGVIAPSQPILADLAKTESLDPARMLWIPNGVDTACFRPMDPSARGAARHGLGLDDDAVAFCCVARLAAAKCHDDLIAAFADVLVRQPRARLFLVGDGPLQTAVEAQLHTLGLTDAVTLLGLRLDVETILPAFDAGVLASSTEGMSNAILEMMACGLPVVATAVGGNPTLVEHEVTGRLVPTRQPGALAAAMTALAADAVARRRMGNAARARIERDFSLAAMVRAFDHAYLQLLDSA